MGKKTEPTTKFKVDISDLKKGINEANQSIRLANAQFKAAAAGMDDWEKSSDGVTAKLEQLGKVLTGEKTKLANYKEEQKRLDDAYAENGRRADELRAAMKKLADDGVSKNSEEYKKLQKELAAVEKEQGENQKASDKLKVTVLNQEAAVAKTEKEIRNYEKSLDSLGKESDEASKDSKQVSKEIRDVGESAEETEKKTSSLGKALAGGFAKGIKAVFTAGIASAAAGAAALGKAVISSYADYEQLVGGVDTLFKKSSGKLQKYAANAYKTAGMTANNYMETVTSFSASLISSLDGDTEKAAEYANKAITDMSDNANKMGTDMESIQNAYQGFAKQNYTMLDNLKLGYGGTKEEMQRLLSDAEAISGVKYDVSSYADVVAAIHVIQENMGIAGATALEAEHTISGSISSLKSAISNLVTGFGDANADMKLLCKNVVDAFKNVIKNIAPIVANIVKALPTVTNALLEAVAGLIPSLLQVVTDLFSQMLSTLLNLMPSLVDAVGQAGLTIINTLLEKLPMVLDVAIQIVNSLINGIGQALPQLISAVVGIIPKLVTTLVSGLPQIIAAGITLLDGIVQAIPTVINSLLVSLPTILETIFNAILNGRNTLLSSALTLLDSIVKAIPKLLPTLSKALPKILLTIINYLIKSTPQMLDSALQLLNAIVEAIPLLITELVPQIPTIVTSIINTLLKSAPALLKTGQKILSSIISGIVSLIPKLVSAAGRIGSAVLNTVKGIPAKMLEIGRNIVSGVWQGIQNAKDRFISNVKGFFGGIVSSVKGILGIHSPSKVFAEIGKFSVEGFEKGFADSMRAAKRNIGNLVAQLPQVSATAVAAATQQPAQESVTYNFYQNNYSPKPLSRLDIYRQSKNLLSARRISGV